MKDNQQKEKLLDRVKSSLPGILRVIVSYSPIGRALGLAATGVVLTVSLVYPDLIDGNTLTSVLTALGV